MKFDKRPIDRMALVSQADFAVDHRARLAREESENEARRRKEEAEQRSEANTDEQRIRVWERVHQVALPADATHPLLQVIASRTGLSLDAVRAEQSRRGPVQRGPASRARLSWNRTPIT